MCRAAYPGSESPGGEGFSGTIPAGLYTLTVQGGHEPGIRSLVFEPALDGTRQHRAIFWPVSGGVERGGRDWKWFRYDEFEDQGHSGQSLANVHVFRARLERVSFVGADMRYASLEGTEFKDCNFDGAILSSSFWRNSRMSGCTFEGARMEDMFVDETSIRRTSFRRANLQRVTLRSVQLVDVDFSEADVFGIKVEDVQPPELGHWLWGQGGGRFVSTSRSPPALTTQQDGSLSGVPIVRHPVNSACDPGRRTPRAGRAHLLREADVMRPDRLPGAAVRGCSAW